ncbi:MAG: NAD-dependent epimerase/dehydratase family protein [Anaerolineales bacterium]
MPTTKKKIILISGVATFWGQQVAAKLTAIPGLHVIGIDNETPEKDIKDLDFIQTDIRNPLLTELVRNENVDAACHLAFEESARPNEASFDYNVMGAMKFFGACAEAGVRKIVLKSSSMVYGAHHTNPAFITEDHPLRGSRRYGYTRDMVEIEAFCNGFRRQHPQILVSILRFANIVGPNADTPFTRFLRSQKTPVLLGFDPMIQVIHEQDVVDALVHAILTDVPGVFNLAAEGALPLWRALGLAGKTPLPVLHLLPYWSSSILGSKQTEYLPIEPDYLRYRWVTDLARMKEEFGFTPHYNAPEALREFAGQQRMRHYLPQAAARAYDEERLRDTIERRKRAREAAAAQEPASRTRGKKS